jgi:prepilin-type processing-associated H-X9-DG protein
VTAPTLDYNRPAPPSPERYLGYAKKCSGWGFLVPFLGLIGIGFGIATAAQESLSNAQRKSGMQWAGIGVLATLINPLMCIAIVLPSLGHARPESNVIKCASNLRQIGLAIQMYANDNNDALTPDIVTLLSTQDLTTDVFLCPQSEHDTIVRGGGPASVVEGTSTCSYLFYRFPSQKLGQLPRDAILVFEKDCFHTPANQGMNVLHADGSVTTLTEAEAKVVMRELMTGQNPPPSLRNVNPTP